MLSVIIPTYNERNNVGELVKRLSKSLSKFPHELIFIDDHSTDDTLAVLSDLADRSPKDNIRILSKQGRRGKAQSILEGIIEARGEALCMIDADLQYPPEAIAAMYAKLSQYDVVVARRNFIGMGLLRQAASRAFNFFFGKILLGLDVDVQSGLKLFRKQTLNGIRLSPSPWGFDYEFLYQVRRMGWRTGEVEIDFVPRLYGQSQVSVLATGWELGTGAVKLRGQYLLRSIFKFTDWPHTSERLGVDWNNTKDFLFVPEILSAKKTWYAETVILVLTLLSAASLVVYGFHKLTGIPVLVIISGIMAVFYVIMMYFKLRVIYYANKQRFLRISPAELDAINPYDLPTYTILIPLYKEAEVIRQIAKAMTSIDYPTDKLDIIITLEEYDRETIQAIDDVMLPPHFRTLILPDVQPKTKPKALNVAFKQAKGEFLVIYDAEIVPDPDQLKKAVVAFRDHPEADVLQTRLDHYNPEQNTITRLFNEEFAFHFDQLLPGLQKLNYPIPLSGHSVHFRKTALEDIGAWDPYNVTEDADTGIKLARTRHKIEILDSFSREEATSSFSAWVKQRTRWIKGFIQTSIVHSRHPIRFKNELGIGWTGLVAFGLTVPASVFINIANLVYWGLLVGWFATHSRIIQSLFPGPIFYVSLCSFVFGNLVFVYLNLVSTYSRGRYASVKYGLLSPFYWLMLAFASVKAAIEFIYSPHSWSKTVHGTHLPAGQEERTGTYVIKSPQEI